MSEHNRTSRVPSTPSLPSLPCRHNPSHHPPAHTVPSTTPLPAGPSKIPPTPLPPRRQLRHQPPRKPPLLPPNPIILLRPLVVHLQRQLRHLVIHRRAIGEPDLLPRAVGPLVAGLVVDVGDGFVVPGAEEAAGVAVGLRAGVGGGAGVGVRCGGGFGEYAVGG